MQMTRTPNQMAHLLKQMTRAPKQMTHLLRQMTRMTEPETRLWTVLYPIFPAVQAVRQTYGSVKCAAADFSKHIFLTFKLNQE
jgi:hypothetical protein